MARIERMRGLAVNRGGSNWRACHLDAVRARGDAAQSRIALDDSAISTRALDGALIEDRQRRSRFFFGDEAPFEARYSSWVPRKSVRPLSSKTNRRVAKVSMRSRSWVTTKAVPS